MREKKDYREQIALINDIYPTKITLTVAEAADILGIDRRTVKALIEKKKLAASQVGGRKNKIYIIPKAAVARFASGN